MPTLPRGPTGWLSRLAAQAVPGTVAGVLGWMAGAVAGLPAGALVGLLAWPALSMLLRWVRVRTGLRRAYRVALLAHVLFWCAMGWRESRLAEPGAPVAGQVSAWAASQPFRAGAAERRVNVPARPALAGWGGRPRRQGLPAFAGLGLLGRLSLASMASEGGDGPRAPLLARASGTDARGPLARAVVLRPEQGGTPLALVRLDLLTGDPYLTEAVLERVADLGFAPQTLLVCATHTHSSLGGYARDPLSQVVATDHFDPAAFQALVEAASGAVRAAYVAAVPARLALAEGRDRGPDGRTILAVRRGLHRDVPAEDRVGLLRLESLDGRTLALLVSHGVHPVAVRGDHPALDRDLVGAVEDALEARFPERPPVLFLQSGLGDVSPRVVRRAQAPDALNEAAGLLAEALAPALAEPAHYDRLRVTAARAERGLGDPHAVLTWGDRGAFLEDLGAAPFEGVLPGALADALLLPANALLWSLTLTDVRLAGTLRGGVGARVQLRRLVRPRAQPTGVLALDLGASGLAPAQRLALAWVPGEPTQALAEAWRSLLSTEGGARPWVVALTNGSLGYAVTAEGYAEGGYEATGTLFGAGTARLLTELLETARAALPAR